MDKLGTKLRSILVSLEVWKVSSQLLTCRPAMYDVKFKKEEIHGFSELQKSMDMIIYCLFIYSFIGLFLNIFLYIYIDIDVDIDIDRYMYVYIEPLPNN